MAQHPRPVGPTTNDAATFAPEMVQGAVAGRPSDARSWSRFVARQGGQDSPPTHPAADFSVEMFAGSQPGRFRERLPLRTGWHAYADVIPVITPDMVQGSKPDRYRELLPLRTGWIAPLITNTAATFSGEMSAGSMPERNRAWPVPAGRRSSYQVYLIVVGGTFKPFWARNANQIVSWGGHAS